MWKKLDKSILIVPIAIVVLLTILMSVFPQASSSIVNGVQGFLTDKLGIWYIVFGIACLALVIFFAANKKIGLTKLGTESDKPMSKFSYWSLIFTSTLAADVLYYALSEWMMYWDSDISTLADTSTTSSKVLWSSTLSYVNWGFIPWSFYIVLAVIYGFMFFKSGRRDHQRPSEACRPLFGRHVDGPVGKAIDITAIVCLFFGTSTTFSIATPLMSAIVCKLFGLQYNAIITVIILLVIAIIYTAAVLLGSKGISIVAKITTIAVALVLALFFVLGGPVFMLESGIQGIGNMFAHYIQIISWTDPLRASTTAYPQTWTVYFWAYWIAWCIANPFFIAKISKGRTIRQTVIESMSAGFIGTSLSFMILGGFGMNLQSSGTFDAIAMLNSGASVAEVIVEMIAQIKIWPFILVALFIAMIGLYASTFDALTNVVASMAYKKLDIDEEPSKVVKIIYAFVFIALPIALTFMQGTNALLMSMSIIGALPYSIIIVLIIISFFKDLHNTSKSIAQTIKKESASAKRIANKKDA